MGFKIATLFWGRAYGKTHFLVELCRLDPDAVLVTFTRREAQRIVNTYGLNPWQVMAVQDVRDGVRTRRHGRTHLVVDNLDLMLSELLGAPVSAITASKDSLRLVPEPKERP